MIAAPTAAAQSRTPTPSAKELWRSYPLHQAPQTPQPGTPTPVLEGRPTHAPAAPADEGATPLPLLAGAGLLIAFAGTAMLLLRRRGRRPAPAPASASMRWAAPLLPVAAATAMTPAGRPRPPRLTALATGPPASGTEPEPERETARPPDPGRAWTAEVEWRDDGRGPCFSVVARAEDAEVPILTSPPLEWPPANAEAVQRLTRAAGRLETALLAAGWSPLPPGSAWYSKRFAWAAVAEPAPQERPTPPAPARQAAQAEPAPAPVAAEAEPAPAPVAADVEPAPASLAVQSEPAVAPVEPGPAPLAEAAPAPRAAQGEPAQPRSSGRFKRQVEWPPGTEEGWRCEIRWHAGYVNSRFEAVALAPNRRRGTSVGRSEPFRWLMKADPEPAAPEYAAQVRSLAEGLLEAGWKAAGRGRYWYELRFFWDGDEPPSTDLVIATADGTRQGGLDDGT